MTFPSLPFLLPFAPIYLFLVTLSPYPSLPIHLSFAPHLPALGHPIPLLFAPHLPTLTFPSTYPFFRIPLPFALHLSTLRPHLPTLRSPSTYPSLPIPLPFGPHPPTLRSPSACPSPTSHFSPCHKTRGRPNIPHTARLASSRSFRQPRPSKLAHLVIARREGKSPICGIILKELYSLFWPRRLVRVGVPV